MHEKSEGKSSPLVSVVMPVHNGVPYLEKCIESVVSQKYEPLEIVIVDDASSDETPEILRKYAARDARIKIITVEKQPALGNVLNIGVKASHGKYIVRMDADDVMLPGRIEKQVEFMESHPEVMVCGGQIELIDGNGKKMRDRKYALDDARLKERMFLFSPFAHPAVIIRRDALAKVGLYPENLKKVEDIKLWFLLAQVGGFANIPQNVLRYRVTFQSESLAKMVEHFDRTDEVRGWALRELGLKLSLGQRFWWFVERTGVKIMAVLPPKVFFWVFDLAKKILG